MTLTEEQREAIRVISKLPMAIGCQLCHPYIMENYGSHFIVLRDMIDSSGTVEPTGGFDLERARGLRDFLQDDCAEVGDVWGEMIAEIERLRGYEIAARDLSADLTKVAGDRDEHAARIKDLEDAHKRSGKKYAKIINELRSSVYANIPGLDVGKIGPDAETGNRDHVVGPDQMVPNGKVWQITEERKKAVCAMTKMLAAIGCQSCHNYIQKYYSNHIAVLRAMLREAEQCKWRCE